MCLKFMNRRAKEHIISAVFLPLALSNNWMRPNDWNRLQSSAFPLVSPAKWTFKSPITIWHIYCVVLQIMFLPTCLNKHIFPFVTATLHMQFWFVVKVQCATKMFSLQRRAEFLVNHTDLTVGKPSLISIFILCHVKFISGQLKWSST